MGQTVKRIEHLREMHSEFNDEYFDGQLMTIPILCKQARRYDGKYVYRAHSDWSAIEAELPRACIYISDALFSPPDWGLIYGTLLHEMIHQYEAEVLKITSDHGPEFTKLALEIESTTDYTIL